MSWVRLDDRFPRHPKTLAAIAAGGPDAGWLWACGLAWCSDYLTDGFIPSSALDSVAPGLRGKKVEKAAQALVTAGLWFFSENVFRVHDYHQWNPSADEQKAKRKATADRVLNWKKKKQEHRENVAANSNAAGGHGTIPERERNAEVTRYQDDGNALVTLPPSPSPSPSPFLKSETRDACAPPDQEFESERPSGVHAVASRPDRMPASEAKLWGAMWRDDFAREVSAALGRAWSFPEKQRSALIEAMRTHCPKASWANASPWLAAEVPKFVAATRDVSTFWGTFGPDGFARWLNAGRPLAAQLTSGRAFTSETTPGPRKYAAPYHKPFAADD